MQKFKILVKTIKDLKHKILNIKTSVTNLEVKLDKLIEEFEEMIIKSELVNDEEKERLSVPKNGEKRRRENE